MKSIKVFCVGVLLIGSFVTNILYGKSAGLSSFDFLKFNYGARAAAMGGAYCNMENDSFSIYYNPALLLSIKKIDTSFAHTEYVENIRNESLNSVININKVGAIGIGLSYLYANDFIKTIRSDTPEGFSEVGNFGFYDLIIIAGGAYQISKNITGGLNIKYLSEKIDVEKGETIAFDVGIKSVKKFFNLISIAGSVRNLGGYVKFIDKKESLPLIITGGISSSFSPFKLNRDRDDIIIAMDIVDEVNYGFKIKSGVEFNLFNLIRIRGGYIFDFNNNSLYNFTAGLGVNYKRFEIGYAFLPFDIMGSTHRFSINVKF